MALKIPKPPIPGQQRKPSRPGSKETTKEKKPIHRHAKEGTLDATAWVDTRLGASGFLRAFLFRKVPNTNWFYTLGFATLFAFLAQTVTGVFLAMYYDPNPVHAYDSVQHITNDVWLGALVRGMHRWGSSVMVVLVFLHMGRTFFFGAYKFPRELNWLVGVVLLILTMVMAFTGYLLPFDQRSFWATVVGVNINGTAPLLGPYLSDFLRAGPEFGATTLARFYAIHMLLIPGAIAALIGVHIYLVTKLGISAPPWAKTKLPEIDKEDV